jgi:hypothetical protein
MNKEYRILYTSYIKEKGEDVWKFKCSGSKATETTILKAKLQIDFEIRTLKSYWYDVKVENKEDEIVIRGKNANDDDVICLYKITELDINKYIIEI